MPFLSDPDMSIGYFLLNPQPIYSYTILSHSIEDISQLLLVSYIWQSSLNINIVRVNISHLWIREIGASVIWEPFGFAKVAKLILAEASHMLAACVLFDESRAFRALFVRKPILQMRLLSLLTRSRVLEHKTESAESASAKRANYGLFLNVEEALALILRAEPQRGVFQGSRKPANLSIALILLR